MSPYDISIIVNAHAEGMLLKPSIDSALGARARAEAKGIRTELIIVLDRVDLLTRTVAVNCIAGRPSCRLEEVDNGDLGLSRNDGASLASGEYVAFLDGDDMWGPDWLARTYALASVAVKETVWHPEVNVYFGGSTHIFLHIDSEDPSFDPSGLAYANYWTALCFVRRAFLLQVPYGRTRLASQLGYEDWGWNLHTMALGAIHKIVPGTGHAVRTKPPGTSLLSATAAANCLTSPSFAFLKMLGELPDGASRLRISP